MNADRYDHPRNEDVHVELVHGGQWRRGMGDASLVVWTLEDAVREA